MLLLLPLPLLVFGTIEHDESVRCPRAAVDASGGCCGSHPKPTILLPPTYVCIYHPPPLLLSVHLEVCSAPARASFNFRQTLAAHLRVAPAPGCSLRIARGSLLVPRLLFPHSVRVALLVSGAKRCYT